jgi:glycosyltransferase involved in cell wall biosynthesis
VACPPITVLHYWGGCPQAPNSRWWQFVHLIEQCSRRGWRNCLVWARMPDDAALSRPFQDCGCEIILQPRARGNFDPWCVHRTFRMLKHVRCDVFHCHNIHTSPLIAATLARVPVRLWSKLAMSPYYEQGIRPRGVHRLAPSVRVSCALSHRILAISESVRTELLESGASPAKVLTVPAPVHVGLYARASADGIRESLGLPASALVITTVGHAVPVKGWDILIRAYAQVAAQAPESRLLLVGSTADGDEVETTRSLRSLAEQLGVLDRVVFPGRRSDIPRILAGSDIFVLPSRSEGRPFALLEALAAGLPCVVARVGGIPEMISHNENGILFEREDASGLAAALGSLMSDSQLRSRLSAGGRTTAERFGLREATDAMLALYEELLGKGGLRDRPASHGQEPSTQTGVPLS